MAVYKRGDKWAVRVSKHVGGKRIRKSGGLFTRKKDADAKEREMLQQLGVGIDITQQTMTIAQLIERYITNCEARNIGTKSIERYRELAANQINPYIGTVTLEDLRKSHVVHLIEKLATCGNVRTKKALAPKSIKHAISLLRTALDWAVDMEIIVRNVAHHARLPKVKRREAKAIDGDEARRLLASAASERGPWGRLFTVALTIGARRGEVAALKWSDVDFEGGTVTIRRALSQTRTKGTFLKETKTDQERTVKLSPAAVSALKAQRVTQAKERLRHAQDYQRNDFVFANPLGETLHPNAISNAFHRIATAAGLSTTRLHDLRHTFASWLLESGENIETVRDALGHSTSYTTLTVYGHVMKKAQAASVAVIDERLEAQ